MQKKTSIILFTLMLFVFNSCNNFDQSKESPSLIPDTIGDADHTQAVMPADTATIMHDSLGMNADTSQTIRTSD